MPLTIGGPKQPSRQSLLALDYLNFFLADVRTGVGPFMATYLMASLHWNPADIGVAMAIMGIATLLAETPCGALADSVKEKRLLIVIAGTLVGLCSTGITIFPNYFINTSQVIIGVAAAIFPLAVTAITLGIVGQQKFAIRIGRNEMFNHAGNVAAAILAGTLGHFLGREWIFYVVTIFAGATIVSTLLIRKDDIDYFQARAAIPKITPDGVIASSITAVLIDRNILVFALAVTLFHFANAAMLPLAGTIGCTE